MSSAGDAPRSRLLVVDDDDQMARLVVRLAEGVDCDIAPDADAALELVGQRPYDLALVDVNLPGGSGIDLLRELHRAAPDTAVVMVTGDHKPSTAAAALELGSYGYVIKPFAPTELQIAIDSALRRRRLEVENRRMMAELQERDETKNALLAAVSHDLRSPLAGIAGFARLLDKRMDRLAPEQVHTILEEIVSTAQATTKTLQDMLDADRVSQGIVVKKPTDVGALLTDIAAAVDLGARPLHLACPSTHAMVDAALVQSVVVNLLRNAAAHTAPTTEIWLSVVAVRTGVEIVVADAGEGIGDDEKAHVFEQFRKGAASQGSGVGLSLVQRFAALHGGSVVVEDRPGGGALFRVALATADA